MRLIDADALLDMMPQTEKARVLVEASPTIDAEPVVRGRWEYVRAYDGQLFIRCSVCGGCRSDLCADKYCSECGAKMDKERLTL